MGWGRAKVMGWGREGALRKWSNRVRWDGGTKGALVGQLLMSTKVKGPVTQSLDLNAFRVLIAVGGGGGWLRSSSEGPRLPSKLTDGLARFFTFAGLFVYSSCFKASISGTGLPLCLSEFPVGISGYTKKYLLWKGSPCTLSLQKLFSD